MKITFKSKVNLPINNEEINFSLNKYFEILSNFNHIKKNESIIGNKKNSIDASDFSEIEKKIINILETKVRPAVAKDGGDIKFKEFKNGIVKVELQGSCSGCPSSTMTLKQGVQNLLCHYLPEVKEVIAI